MHFWPHLLLWGDTSVLIKSEFMASLIMEQNLTVLQLEIINQGFIMAFISCVLCDKVFENQRKLLKHRNKVHSKKIKCKVCEKEFSGIYNAERHEKIVHEGSMASCPCCLQELT